MPLAGGRLRRMATSAIAAVAPDRLVRRAVTRLNDTLQVDGRKYQLNRNVYLVGAGKAVLAMLPAIEELVRPHLIRGIISVPVGALRGHPEPPAQVEVCEGAADNLPDLAAARTAGRIADLASSLTASDLLLVLVSGGGSALIPAPRPPLTLQVKTQLTAKLAARGASIQELNTVRRPLSRLKGGGLARIAAPARTLGLVLSDVIGDPLDLIASGPTVVDDHSEPSDPDGSQSASSCDHGSQSKLPTVGDSQSESGSASFVLKKFDLLDTPLVRETLASAAAERASQPSNPQAHTALIGSNSIALEAMLEDASVDHQAMLVSSEVHGDCDRVARVFAELTHWLLETPNGLSNNDLPSCLSDNRLKEFGISPGKVRDVGDSARRWSEVSRRPLCLLFGGETTVTVRGSGTGGRNQQLALAFAIQMDLMRGRVPHGYTVQLICCGTDGIDGPNDAAGAVVSLDTVQLARSQGLDPAAFLADNNSYEFFARYDGGSHHIRIGHTGTNVMDVMALVVTARCLNRL